MIRESTLGEAKYLFATTLNLFSDNVRLSYLCTIERLLDIDQLTFNSLSFSFILFSIEKTTPAVQGHCHALR